MSVVVIRKEQEDYPFKFLSPERYDVQGALELISMMYEAVARQEGPSEIMTIQELVNSTIDVFRKERYARMIIHGDYEDEDSMFDIHGDTLCTYFNELSEEEGVSLGDFLDKICEETDTLVSHTGTYFENFCYDVRYALGSLGLVYYNLGIFVRDYPHGQKEDHIPMSAYLKNSVVKEVW